MTPDCTVCGYAVEWLRSCYASQWRLTEDSTTLTPGRYVFCPDDTPFYPGFTYLGSRNWTTDDSPNFPRVLGEGLDARQRWHSGFAPEPYPAAITIGSADCLTSSQPLDTVCEWQFTQEGGASWSLPGGFPRIDFEDSQNCGGSNSSVQLGAATLEFHTSFESSLTVHLAGRVERQNFGFDVGTVTIDGELLLVLESEGDGLGCLMLDVERTAVRTLLPPGRHVLRLEGNTVDGLYHVGAFFELTWLLDPPIPSDNREWFQGYDLRCYIPSYPPVIPPWLPDLFDRRQLGDMAEVMVLLYADVSAAAARLLDIMGPGSSVSSVENTAALTPGTLIGTRDELTVIVIAGTTNFLQIATQMLFAGTGPVDLGTYSSNATWVTAAQAIHQRVLDAAADPTGRVLLVGHSYGGALASIMAADYLAFNPVRQVEVLTFGAPKPGDVRLTNLLRLGRLVRIADAGDPVPGIPPAYPQVWAYLTLLPAGLVLDWTQLQQPPGQLVLGSDGVITETDATTLDLLLVTQAVTCALLNIPLPFPFPHSSAEYLRRLRLSDAMF